MRTRQKTRSHLAWAAARLMAEQGIDDPQQALNKAAARLGQTDRRQLPEPDEVDAALIEYNRLFRPAMQSAELDRQRVLALEAMEFLAEFDPRLTGAALDGTAGRHSSITLQVFADAPEEVMRKLLDAHVPFRETSCRCRLRGENATLPALSFYVDETPMELCIFPATAAGRAAAAGNREGGASIRELRTLLGRAAGTENGETD
ncbi:MULTISPECIES: hypothetical protein [Methylococcus]|uniref:Uncharacterized protein n=1 Tax=Methylococcus capsulatus TaxID=414 RepID=A0AA35UYL9_METCP|nr:hypothetical protein [Methylococcus capsulatus]QXP89773.1 hypothetical protein KW114_11825 [Methylococcus capsulatus]CAI8773187.1 conserved protein of unknown function [Methylococcus capsulatus]